MDFKKMSRATIQQIPSYMPGKPIEEVERELGLSGVIKMASNENPLGPSNEVRQAITKALDRIALYPDSNNYFLLQALTAELDLPAAQLIVGNGLDDVNRILAETFLNPEDEVVIPEPTFSQYQIVTLLMGAKPVLVKASDGLTHDLQAIKAAITTRTKLIFLCNPNNPTGQYFNKQDLMAFLNGLPDQLIVVLDEAYADFVDAPDFPNGLELLKAGFQNLIVYRTFSKIHGIAGLRLGYAMAAPELITQLQRVKDPFNVNLLAQTAGIAALAAKKHVNLSRELVLTAKHQYYLELQQLDIPYLETQANFILINCLRDSKEIYQNLLENGIIVRATHSFGLPQHIRVTFGTAEQNNRFFKAFSETLKKLAE